MNDDPLTGARIDDLLGFLPLFEVPGRCFVKAWAGAEETPDGAITVPFPEYCDDVLEFFWRAGQPCWSDFDYDPRNAHAMLSDDAFIAACTLEEIKTMLTYCVRGERFVDGHWERMLMNGRIVAILRRLVDLRDAAGSPAR
jgi:hypothetical protein